MCAQTNYSRARVKKAQLTEQIWLWEGGRLRGVNFKLLLIHINPPHDGGAFYFVPILTRVMDRAADTEMVDAGSIPGRVKSKTIKIDIHSFPA